MAIQKTLLVGNGLNRAVVPDSSKSIFAPLSWNETLNKLSAYANLNIRNIDKKPLTLVFDEILLKLKDTGIRKIDLQHMMSQLTIPISNQHLDELFYPLTKHALTTNYSSMHAYHFGNPYPAMLPRVRIDEKTFSLFRYYATPKDRRLWYINGNAGTPTSLTLGYRQYARYQAQIKNYLTSGLDYTNFRVANSPLFRNQPNFDFDKSDNHYSWVDLFLRDDIHVVGLSMDYTESILWWLLTEKLTLQQKFSKRVGGFSYYQINIDGKQPKGSEAEKLMMLGDLGVNIKTFEAETYLDGYLNIAETFKKGTRARYENAIAK